MSYELDGLSKSMRRAERMIDIGIVIFLVVVSVIIFFGSDEYPLFSTILLMIPICLFIAVFRFVDFADDDPSDW